MNIISWNLNGIRAAVKKNIMDWILMENADIVCFQETRATSRQIPQEVMQAPGYHKYFSSPKLKKGYSGTGILTKNKPESIRREIGKKEFDNEGRFLIAEYEKFILFNVYFPNGKSSPERLKYKINFYEAFLKHIEKMRLSGKSVVFTGDVNTAHKEIDLARPDQNRNVSGFLPQERKWIDKVIKKGYIDTFRHFYPRKEKYTWWSFRTRARERNVGWRLDYFFVSSDLKDFIEDSIIYTNVSGSDHCPIGLILDL